MGVWVPFALTVPFTHFDATELDTGQVTWLREYLP